MQGWCDEDHIHLDYILSHGYFNLDIRHRERNVMKNSLFLVLSLTISLSFVAAAQTTESGLGSMLPAGSPASYYYVAKPGELTMQVNIWGDVQKPGRYEVASSTDLIQLLSYAGGPTREGNLSEVRVSRIVKGDMGLRRQQLTVNLEDFLDLDQASLVLYPNDKIFVDYSTRFNARDVFTVITTAALVTAAIAQVIYAGRR
jgi:hypothetical protein